MKEEVKEKLIMFVLGLIVGVVIASGCYAFSNHVQKNSPNNPKVESRQEMKEFKQDGTTRQDRGNRQNKGLDSNQQPNNDKQNNQV